MVFQRIISRFPGRSIISGQTQRLSCRNSNPSVKFSDQSLFQITQKRDLFSGSFENNGASTRVLRNDMPSLLEKIGFAQANSLFSSLKFASSIHSVGQKEFERGMNNGPVHTEKNTGFFEGPNRRLDDINRRQPSFETGRNPGYLESLSRRMLDNDRTRFPPVMGRDDRPFNTGFGSYGFEQNPDVVHIKIKRNNAFVTVTDHKGNKKMGTSAGALAEMKGGPKVARYSAEATAEHVGRVAKSMGLKSVVIKVNGFTYFKKKKLAMLSFRDGYTNSRTDRNPIVYIEDTTRKPHNGCRLKKRRRV